MTNLYDDLRYAVRSLRKAPLFTAVAVLSMGFGIAANTAVFTLVDQVILRQLPVDRPQELVQVTAANTESYGGGMGDGTELSYAMYKDLRDAIRSSTTCSAACSRPRALGYAAASTEQVRR